MNGSMGLVLVGTAAGACVALLFAPAGARALRATVRPRPYLDLQRLHAEWQARMAENPRSDPPEAGK